MTKCLISWPGDSQENAAPFFLKNTFWATQLEVVGCGKTRIFSRHLERQPFSKKLQNCFLRRCFGMVYLGLRNDVIFLLFQEFLPFWESGRKNCLRAFFMFLGFLEFLEMFRDLKVFE